MKPGVTLSGRVVFEDAQTGSGSARLCLQNNDEYWETRTGPNGWFTVADLLPVDYKLWLTDSEFVVDGQPVTVNPIKRFWTTGHILARRGGSVAGQLVDAATGDGIGGVWVSASPAPEAGRTGWMEAVRARTANDGSFTLGGLPAGEVRISYEWDPNVPPSVLITDPSRSFGWVSVNVEWGKDLAGVRLEVDRRFRFSGVIVREDGTVVSGAFVNFAAHDRLWQDNFPVGRVPAVRSDDQGRFTGYLGGPSAQLFLQAASPGWASCVVGPVKVGAGGLNDVQLVMKPAGHIAGRILDASGRPPLQSSMALAGKTHGGFRDPIHVRPMGAPPPRTGVGLSPETDALLVSSDGYFYLGNLTEDTYTARFWRGSSGETPANVDTSTLDLGSGEARDDVTLTMGHRAGGTVSGTILVAGRPTPNARVGDSKSDLNGSYMATGVGPGDVSIDATYYVTRNGIEEQRRLAVPLSIAEGETVSLNIEFAAGTGVVEGVVRKDSGPVVRAMVSCNIEWEDESTEEILLQTNSEGYYRMDGLPPGILKIRIYKQENNEKSLQDETEVEVLAEGVTRADFIYDIGTVMLSVRGLRSHETGRVAVVPGEVELEEITPELVEKLEYQAVLLKEFQDRLEVTEQIPAGVYTVIVGAFDDTQPDEESTIATLRWKSVVAEVAEGMETAVEVELE